MKEKIKAQRGFIQIPLLIGIIVSIVVISVATTGVVLYKRGELAPFVTNVSQIFKGTKDIEPEIKSEEPQQEQLVSQEENFQAEQELDQTRLEAEKTKAEVGKLKKEADEIKSETSQQAVISTPPANTTFCNGMYWSKCPDGQDFVCPQSGKAYCQLNQQQQAQALQQAQTAKQKETQLLQEFTVATVKYNKSLQDYVNEIMACIDKVSAAEVAKYDAQIQATQAEIDQWKWHLANLCDTKTACPIGGKYLSKDVGYIESRISNLEYWKAVYDAYKLGAKVDANVACGVPPINTTNLYKAITDSFTSKPSSFRSSNTYESYTISPNGMGGYNILDSKFQTWTIAPNSFGGYTITEPNFSTWQSRPNGMGGYEVTPF